MEPSSSCSNTFLLLCHFHRTFSWLSLHPVFPLSLLYPWASGCNQKHSDVLVERQLPTWSAGVKMERKKTERVKGLNMMLEKCTQISGKHGTNEPGWLYEKRLWKWNDFPITHFRTKTELLKWTFSILRSILKVPEPLLSGGWRINENEFHTVGEWIFFHVDVGRISFWCWMLFESLLWFS